MVTEVYYIIQHTPTRLILYGYSDSVTEVCIFNFVLDIVIARPVSSGEQTRRGWRGKLTLGPSN